MSALPYFAYAQYYPTIAPITGGTIYENHAHWPKSFQFYPDYSAQGIHPPGQVWTSNQPASQPYQYYNYPGAAPGYYYAGQYGQYGQYGQFPMPTGTTNPTHYYYSPQFTSIAPYCHYSAPYSSDPLSNPFQSVYSKYYQDFYKGISFPLPSYITHKNPYLYMQYLVPGGPSVLPMPNCPAAMSAQAATALANNAALAAMPSAPSYWVGATPADYAAQQAIVAGMMGSEVKPSPTQLAPYKPADGQQFWCKELDGSWTLRTHSDIVMGEVGPGHWERHTTSGYFYWIRHTP